jgi:hypothetical protein
MSFKETKTFSNQESSVRIDVEALARLEISDIEFILETAKNSDARLKKVLYESALTKCATAWQLAMKAWEYLDESEEELKNMIGAYPKSARQGIGLIGKIRGELFHQGIGFYERTTYYPFGKVYGRGYVAIRVKKSGCLNIKGYASLKSKDSEYVITSEGIYEIMKADTDEEKWIKRDDLLTVDASDDRKVEELIKCGLSDLQVIWNNIKKYRLSHLSSEITFLNDGGGWSILEDKDGQISEYESKNCLRVEGFLDFSAPKAMKLKPSEGTIEYSSKPNS